MSSTFIATRKHYFPSRTVEALSATRRYLMPQQAALFPIEPLTRRTEAVLHDVFWTTIANTFAQIMEEVMIP
jgi:hypothetical protein